jgi:biotin carboxylase
MSDGIERFLCVASHEKGHDFLRQCEEMGVRPTLLTLDGLRNAGWPREALEEVATMPAGLSREQILNTVSWMARGRRFDRVIALDESDLETAAQIREHMRIPGMGATTMAYYRDKLAMRIGARESGFLVPEFCRVLNYDEVRDFMLRVPAPWLLKSRSDSAGLAIRTMQEPEQVWRALDELGDLQSHFLLEQFVPGDVFHVDSILSDCKVLFSIVHRYDCPTPQENQGGVSTTCTVDRGSRDWMELTALNAGLAPSLGMVRGITHAEFVRSSADGRFYFLQIAARVGGAFLADLVEVSTGVNLWREWARLEIDFLRGQTYVLPQSFESYAGSVLCPAQTVEPDISCFKDPEIVMRMNVRHHAGLLVRSGRPERVKQLLEQLSGEFARRFLAPAQPQDRPTPA